MNQDSNLKILKHEFEILETHKLAIFRGVYLTLVSVIGSVAIGLVANQLREHFCRFIHVCDLTWKEWILIELSFASILVIVTVITAYFSVISYFYWEIGIGDILTPLSVGIMLILISTHVDQPETWLFWISIFAIMGGISYKRTRNKIEKKGKKCKIKNEVEVIRKLKKITVFKEETKNKIENFINEQLRYLNIVKWGLWIAGFVFLFYGIITNYIIKYYCPHLKNCKLFIFDVPVIALTVIVICFILLYAHGVVYKKRRDFFHKIEEETKEIIERRKKSSLKDSIQRRKSKGNKL